MDAAAETARLQSMFGLLLVRAQPLGSLFSLNGRPRYIHEGWFLISVANLTVIVTMIVVFCLALVLPFPHDKADKP
jgi:hypothetical protein